MKLPAYLLSSAAALLLSTGIAAAATVVAEADLNLRSGPGTQYLAIAVIPAGASVDASQCSGGWCRVDYDGDVGWASSVYLGGATAQIEPYYYTEPYYNYYDYYNNDTPFAYGFGPEYFSYSYSFHHGDHYINHHMVEPFPQRHFGGFPEQFGHAQVGIAQHTGGAPNFGSGQHFSVGRSGGSAMGFARPSHVGGHVGGGGRGRR